ncbi:hypothetical protein NM688_g6853 [Phlebia brevispora]|uniref:Uncharacterized protein n=1 Tax=Phlebia brevispora TaxID=194682 RepID=A0ACC1SC21_9APHY|nr:hypothetical protein NM688_g6853 [Phlebia brevispora]
MSTYEDAWGAIQGAHGNRGTHRRSPSPCATLSVLLKGNCARRKAINIMDHILDIIRCDGPTTLGFICGMVAASGTTLPTPCAIHIASSIPHDMDEDKPQGNAPNTHDHPDRSAHFQSCCEHFQKDPERYVQDVVEFLSQATLDTLSDSVKLPETIVYILPFLSTLQQGNNALYMRIMNRDFWRDEERPNDFRNDIKVMIMVLETINRLLFFSWGAFNKGTSSAVAFSSTQKVLVTEKEPISDFLRKLWFCRRTLVGSQQLMVVASNYCIALEFLYDGFPGTYSTSLISSFREYGALVLYLWSHRTQDRKAESLTVNMVSDRLLRVEQKHNLPGLSMWLPSLHILMNTHDDARDVIKMCAWNIKQDLVDRPLCQVLSLTLALMRECPQWQTYPDVHRPMARVMLNSLRAVQRQLCSGDEDSEYTTIVQWNFEFPILCKTFCAETILELDSDSRNLVHADVIALIARHSVQTVLDPGPNGRQGVLVGLLKNCQTIAEARNAGINRRVSMAPIQVAYKHARETCSALRRISVTDPAIRSRKVALLGAWSQYVRKLETYVPNLGGDHVPVVHAWETCASKACLCHGRVPHHRLRVCKGCWQVFYCNAKCQQL